jgi:glycosyltransferase involved in cell wall biosynthesis
MTNNLPQSKPRESSQRPAASCSYVLITPARNEAAFIELTLKSVVAQTLLPVKWLIVSDGSTDGTDEIVRRYAAEHTWIELVRMPERQERHFAGKVHAFNAGYERVRSLNYDIIGSLDGDISFDADYFEFLLGKFIASPELGVAGTPFSEGGTTYDYRFTSPEHVSGACQIFRRQCFEAIGGYVPIKGGGIDLIAVLTARMKGWQTRTFLEKTCLHHRKQGSAAHTTFANWFNVGRKDYVLGGHPLWEVFRCVYQMSKPPFIVGGGCLLAGYLWAMSCCRERSLSRELMKFRRVEQMVRLRKFLLARAPFQSGR